MDAILSSGFFVGVIWCFNPRARDGRDVALSQAQTFGKFQSTRP